MLNTGLYCRHNKSFQTKSFAKTFINAKFMSYGSHAIVSFGKTSRKLADGTELLKYLPFVFCTETVLFNFVFTLNSHLNGKVHTKKGLKIL